MIGIAWNNSYGAAYAYGYPIRFGTVGKPPSMPPVTPISPVQAAERRTSTPVVQMQQMSQRLPVLREGVDPVEMAVRGRIQYLDFSKGEDAPNAAQRVGAPEREEPKSPREVMEEARCETCENRKYQDGSDDPGVSFKTAQRIAPEQAASAVRGHEMEHVSRERAAAKQEGRKVIQQTVSLHTEICPECGDVYVSGGTTRTTTARVNREELAQQAMQAKFGGIWNAIA